MPEPSMLYITALFPFTIGEVYRTFFDTERKKVCENGVWPKSHNNALLILKLGSIDNNKDLIISSTLFQGLSVQTKAVIIEKKL